MAGHQGRKPGQQKNSPRTKEDAAFPRLISSLGWAVGDLEGQPTEISYSKSRGGGALSRDLSILMHRKVFPNYQEECSLGTPGLDFKQFHLRVFSFIKDEHVHLRWLVPRNGSQASKISPRTKKDAAFPRIISSLGWATGDFWRVAQRYSSQKVGERQLSRDLSILMHSMAFPNCQENFSLRTPGSDFKYCLLWSVSPSVK